MGKAVSIGIRLWLTVLSFISVAYETTSMTSIQTKTQREVITSQKLRFNLVQPVCTNTWAKVVKLVHFWIQHEAWMLEKENRVFF